MKPILVASALLVQALSPDIAFAFCFEPSFTESPPDPPGTYERPDVPFCLSDYSWSGQHSCDSWELDSYEADVEAYVGKLSRYADEAAGFANSAANFASEAFAYAKCEAKDVVEQHE
jgi:hypothetical protein